MWEREGGYFTAPTIGVEDFFSPPQAGEVWRGETSPPTISIKPTKQKEPLFRVVLLLMLALPIFPGRLQPSIVGRSELNFRVRDGNGWTLALISTNFLSTYTLKTEQCIL